MRSNRSSLRSVALALAVGCGVAASPFAFAAVQRTFVSSTGSDAQGCSLTQPCRSFAAAITQTLAGGEVIVLDSAGYGPVTVNKAVSIIAPAGIYAGISVFSGDGISVNAPGAIVVLRGLSVNGLGGTHGINLHAAAQVRIESCLISGMAQDGVHHTASGADVAILDTIVRDNGNFGINVVADGSVALDRVRSEHNDTSGLHIGPASANVSARVSDSVFAHNGASGIVAESHISSVLGGAVVFVERSVLSDNVGSGYFSTASPGCSVLATLAHNAIDDNGGDGIALQATFPDDVGAIVSENTMTNNQNAIHVTGGTASASVNTMGGKQADLRCDSGSLLSFGNNYAFGISGSCVMPVSAK